VRLTRENRWERCQRERMLVPSRTVMECRSRRGPTPNVAASHWRCCGTYGDKAKPPGRTGAFSFPPRSDSPDDLFPRRCNIVQGDEAKPLVFRHDWRLCCKVSATGVYCPGRTVPRRSDSP
jgi:hypothetical protein